MIQLAVLSPNQKFNNEKRENHLLAFSSFSSFSCLPEFCLSQACTAWWFVWELIAFFSHRHSSIPVLFFFILRVMCDMPGPIHYSCGACKFSRSQSTGLCGSTVLALCPLGPESETGCHTGKHRLCCLSSYQSCYNSSQASLSLCSMAAAQQPGCGLCCWLFTGSWNPRNGYITVHKSLQVSLRI